MFLGQEVSFTESANTLTIANLMVGALHLSVSGYTQVRLQGTGGTLDTTFELEEGYNLLTFTNVALTAIDATFTGTGTVDWTNAKLYETDIDLTSEVLRHRPGRYNPVIEVLEGSVYGASKVLIGELTFEWNYLPWDKVDELEVLFDRLGIATDPTFVLIPDGYESERFKVVITSPFDFYPSVDGNFNSGASGALTFSTV